MFTRTGGAVPEASVLSVRRVAMGERCAHERHARLQSAHPWSRVPLVSTPPRPAMRAGLVERLCNLRGRREAPLVVFVELYRNARDTVLQRRDPAAQGGGLRPQAWIE